MVTCFCGGEMSQMPERLPAWRELQMNLYMCGTCRHVTVHPTLTPAQLSTYYETEYQYMGRGYLDVMVVNDVYSWMEAHNGCVVHDYGCGDGYHMEQLLNRQPALRITGYAQSLSSVEKARARGLWGVWGDPAVRAEADLVTLIHVLEHSPNPIETLMHARNSMKSSGRMMLRMPNALFGINIHRFGIGKTAFTQWTWCGVPWHLNYFTPASITQALRLVGLYPETIECSIYTEMVSAEQAAHNAATLQGEELVVLARNLV
jgi:hypothetical protein